MYLYIDGSLLAHQRAFHNTESQVTPAMIALDVVQQVTQFIRYYRATRCYFCLDPFEGSWRKHIDPKYKAQRSGDRNELQEKQKEMADIAIQQHIPQLLELLLVPIFQKPYIEADDFIAACIKNNEGQKGVILSTDKDFWQLVNEHVFMLNPIHNYRIFLGTDNCIYRGHADGRIEPAYPCKTNYGEFPPINTKQLLLIRAMAGDNSDNLPGLIGVGDKTAVKAVTENRASQFITENCKRVTPRKTKKNPSPVEVYQDAITVVNHNLRMMTLNQSEVIDKVCQMAREIESNGLRNRSNNYSKLMIWLEQHGYANDDLARQLVSVYTDQWLG